MSENISGCVRWWDSTTNVGVSTWTDRVSSKVLEQWNGDFPSSENAAFNNNQNVLRFNGTSNTLMTTDGINSLLSNDVTVVFVSKFVNMIANSGYSVTHFTNYYGDGVSPKKAIGCQTTPGNDRQAYYGGYHMANIPVQDLWTDADYEVVIFRHYAGSTSSIIDFNGLKTNTGNADNLTRNLIIVGKDYYNHSAFLLSNIYVYNRVISDSDVGLVYAKHMSNFYINPYANKNRFHMCGKDTDSPETYRFWKSLQNDTDASDYSGPKNGSTPLSFIHVRKQELLDGDGNPT